MNVCSRGIHPGSVLSNVCPTIYSATLHPLRFSSRDLDRASTRDAWTLISDKLITLKELLRICRREEIFCDSVLVQLLFGQLKS